MPREWIDVAKLRREYWKKQEDKERQVTSKLEELKAARKAADAAYVAHAAAHAAAYAAAAAADAAADADAAAAVTTFFPINFTKLAKQALSMT